jgi:hypothetical protein
MIAVLKILKLVIVFCLRVSIGMKKPIALGSSGFRVRLSASPAGWRATGSISAFGIVLGWDDLVPKEQTLFAAGLFGDRRAFAVNSL